MSTSVTDKLRRICDRWVGRSEDTMTTPGHCECVGIINGDVDECPWCAFRRVDALLADVAEMGCERDTAVVRAKELEHSARGAQARCSTLSEERDWAIGEFTIAEEERDGLAQQLADETTNFGEFRKHAWEQQKLLREQLAEANLKLDHLQGAVESALADGRWSEWSRFGSRAEAVRHDLECALEESR